MRRSCAPNKQHGAAYRVQRSIVRDPRRRRDFGRAAVPAAGGGHVRGTIDSGGGITRFNNLASKIALGHLVRDEPATQRQRNAIPGISQLIVFPSRASKGKEMMCFGVLEKYAEKKKNVRREQMQWRRREMAAAHSVPSELMRKNASSGDSFCRRFSSGASAVAVMPSPT